MDFQIFIKAVRKIVKEEINKSLKSSVRQAVNEVLAEKFVHTIREDSNKNSLSSIVLENKSPAASSFDENEQEKRRAELRAKIREKISIPNAEEIFMDVAENKAAILESIKGTRAGRLAQVDDDEGIDPRLFGFNGVSKKIK
jgi:membrane-associated HD superfamily phosphohydrolase